MEVAKGLEAGMSDNFEQKRRLFTLLKTEEDEVQKCELLLELLFDDENERKIFRERFVINRNLQLGMKDYREMYESNNKGINKEEESR
jgi:hypothetical protein